MKHKIDEILAFIWFIILPMITVLFVLLTARELFITLNDELGVMYFNIVCLLSIILCGGWAINLIWCLIAWIQEKLHFRYLDKHPEKCVSREQIAKDLEEFAKVLRENKDEE